MDHVELLPVLEETAAEVRLAWSPTAEGWVSPVRSFEGGGTRLGVLVTGAQSVRLWVQPIAEDGRTGPWQAAQETFANAEFRVMVAELGRAWPSARVRVDDPTRFDELAWELRIPVNEPRGTPPPGNSALTPALEAIGVVSRDAWGSRGTTCSTTESDWYRMAVHHTAGNQTSSGTVQGAVQALQAYSMDSAGYCDIPYQFLVGYDGSLWEGRALTYYSGATGGDNNDGNIAMCFLGCYHPSSCPTSGGNAATDAMIAWSRILVQTLAAEHSFATDADTIRGHQDWPDNYTACPGDYVMERMDEIRSSTAPYQATLISQSFGSSVTLAVGETVTGTFVFQNVGTETWSPSSTNLSPLPRDVASSLYDSTWLSTTRIDTVDSEVPPGSTATFSVTLRGSTVGTWTQSFTLVQEWVTWFGDVPYGGGPDDDDLTLTINVIPADTGSADTDTPTTDSATPEDNPELPGGSQGSSPTGGPPGTLVPMEAGSCACTHSGGSGMWTGLLLIGVGVIRSRRRRVSVTPEGSSSCVPVASRSSSL